MRSYLGLEVIGELSLSPVVIPAPPVLRTSWLKAIAARIPEDSSTTDSYLESNSSVDPFVDEKYMSAVVFFDETAAALWMGDVGGPPDDGGPGTPIFLSIGGQTVLIWAEPVEGVLMWKASHYIIGGPDNGIHVSDPITEATPGQCHLVQIHVLKDSPPIIRINDVEYAFTQVNHQNAQNVRIGLAFAWDNGLNDSSDQIVYITDVKVGTTGWGSFDIFSDDFSTGIIDEDIWYGAYEPPLTATLTGPDNTFS